jgi:hypothetical protein
LNKESKNCAEYSRRPTATISKEATLAWEHQLRVQGTKEGDSERDMPKAMVLSQPKATHCTPQVLIEKKDFVPSENMCSTMGHKDLADQMRTTWEKIVHHVGTIHGQNISNELLNRKAHTGKPERTWSTSCSMTREVQSRWMRKRQPSMT